MQINGLGNGMGQHQHNMHQVTECKHGEGVSKKGPSAAPSSSNSSKDGMQKNNNGYAQMGEGFSLSSWWKKILATGQRLYISVWGEAKDHSADLDASKKMPIETSIETVKAAELTGPAFSKPDLHNNPYFSAIEDTGNQKKTAWEKVCVRFQSLTGQLTGRFSGRNSFETKQQKPKQDLRKHSRYREDDLEIDCILTDDSYLLDSYDRKGEYSKLSPKK